MKIYLNDQDINLKKGDKDLFEYKLGNKKVEGFKTKVEAVTHAEESFTEFIGEKYFKK